MVINQMVNGRVVTLRAVAHDSTAPGATDYISEKNHRVANRPAEGKPVSLIIMRWRTVKS